MQEARETETNILVVDQVNKVGDTQERERENQDQQTTCADGRDDEENEDSKGWR